MKTAATFEFRVEVTGDVRQCDYCNGTDIFYQIKVAEEEVPNRHREVPQRCAGLHSRRCDTPPRPSSTGRGEMSTPWWSLPADATAEPIRAVVQRALIAALNIERTLHNGSDISDGHCTRLAEHLTQELDRLRPWMLCFVSRDAIVAAPGFSQLFNILARLFAANLAAVHKSAKNPSSSVAVDAADDSVGQLGQHAGTRKRRLVFNVFSYLKRSSWMCWIILRSRAMHSLVPHEQRALTTALLDHLEICMFQRRTILDGMRRRRQGDPPTAATQGLSKSIAFDLAMLVCALQDNQRAVDIVREHPRFADITRNIFELLSARNAPGNAHAAALSANLIYALAFICEVVHGTTVGTSFFSSDNTEYALHVMLSVAAATPHSKANPSPCHGTHQQTRGKRHATASLIQRVCSGVVRRLSESERDRDLSGVLQRCLSKQGIRRLLKEVATPTGVEPPGRVVPTRVVGLDGEFGTPTHSPAWSGHANIVHPRFLHNDVDVGLLSQSTCRFEVLLALLRASQSAVVCSALLVAGGSEFVEWLTAMVSLTPPPSVQREKKRQKSSNPDNPIGKDWTLPTESKGTPAGFGTGSVHTVPSPAANRLRRCCFFVECMQTAGSLLRGLLLFNASGSVARFLSAHQRTHKKSAKGSIANSDMRPTRRGDCSLAYIISTNLTVLVDSHNTKSNHRDMLGPLRTPARSPPSVRSRGPKRGLDSVLFPCAAMLASVTCGLVGASLDSDCEVRSFVCKLLRYRYVYAFADFCAFVLATLRMADAVVATISFATISSRSGARPGGCSRYRVQECDDFLANWLPLVGIKSRAPALLQAVATRRCCSIREQINQSCTCVRGVTYHGSP